MNPETNDLTKPDTPEAVPAPETTASPENLADAPRTAAGIPIPALKEAIVGVMKTVFDPEIPVNIYDLGMVYDIAITEAGDATVRMTLTSPMCPAVESLPAEVKSKVGAVQGLTSAKVDLVWEPTWTPNMMTDAAKLTLNMM